MHEHFSLSHPWVASIKTNTACVRADANLKGNKSRYFQSIWKMLIGTYLKQQKCVWNSKTIYI